MGGDTNEAASKSGEKLTKKVERRLIRELESRLWGRLESVVSVCCILSNATLF